MWSKHNPRLQVVWDSTCLRALMECPRKYELGIAQGWRHKAGSPHLDAGSLLQEGIERFQLARLREESVEEAGATAVLHILQASGTFTEVPGPEWDYVPDGGPSISSAPLYRWEPWGGTWVEKWRCLGETEYKNERGNRAKCPYSHNTSAGHKWFSPVRSGPVWQGQVGSGSVSCHSCGSGVETSWKYEPDHPSKNRLSVLRAMVAFIDAQHEEKGLQPWALPDGTPAIEHQVVVPFGRKTPGGWTGDPCPSCQELGEVDNECLECGGSGDEWIEEDYLLVANLDELNTWGGRLWPTDNKTTGGSLNETFFEKFSPDVQFDTYDLVTSLLPYPLPVGGVAIRGIRLGREDAEVRLAYVEKTDGQREEWLEDIGAALDEAEIFASSGYYPKRPTNCGRCQFRRVCDLDPSMRALHLEVNFERRPWHPVHREGEGE